MLLGAEPKDYDVVTNATPPEVSAIFPRTVQVGAAFGVVRVLLGHGREYEVATYRTETTYSDGRHPDQVRYSSNKADDVQRRDFTINAMLMDPESQEIFDVVGGKQDLESRLIRAVGDPQERFREDRLRMLRAVRFAARFGFAIEPATMAAIVSSAEKLSGAVSVERIVAELHGIWRSPRPGLGHALLAESGLLVAILPEVPATPYGKLLFQRMGVAADALGLDDLRRSILGWALLRELPEPTLRGPEQLERMKLSREIIRGVLGLERDREVLLGDVMSAPSPLEAAIAQLRLAADGDRALCRAFIEAAAGPTSVAAAGWRGTEANLDEQPLPPRPILGGEDLKRLGYPPGPRFKELLAALDREVLMRRIGSRDEAIAWLRANHPLPS
jgi:tRNA nucleotidyltransferase/poly(A) polymerase